MRNLKRALSLALASVMLLGMMVVGASAASYTDVDDKDNVEAIEVLNAVNVMIGRQGNFEPDEAVNRHEMAVIMAKLYLGVETADSYVGSHPFTDVVPWADKYVAACYENGLVAGTSATTFSGGKNLTAVEAAAMMLRALGYKDLNKGYQGDWRAPITAQANEIRLFAGVASNPSEKLNRNQVAQLALNTLKSPMVKLIDGTFTATDGNGQLILSGGSREYKVIAREDAYATSISAVESKGNGADGIEGYTVELGEHLYNGKLKLNSTTDAFERPARQWEYDGKIIGTYVKDELLRQIWTEKVTGKMIYDVLTKSVIEGSNKYNFTIAVDGVLNTNKTALGTAYFDEGYLNSNHKSAVGGTGNGVQTEVYVDSGNKQVYISVINTYLAKATGDYNAARETATYNVYGLSNKGTTSNPVFVKTLTANVEDKVTVTVSADDFTIAGVKKDDIVLVNVADGTIQIMDAPEVMSGASLSAFAKNDYVVSEGSTIKYNNAAEYDFETLDKFTGVSGATNLRDKHYNLYLDKNGYLAGIEAVEEDNNYIFLTGIDAGTSDLTNKTADAAGILMDGTFINMKVNMDKSKRYNPVTKAWDTDFAGGSMWNTWCTYSVDNSGVYTLKQVGADPTAAGSGKVAQAHAGAYVNSNTQGKTINIKNYSLPGTGTYTYVYGNENSVYMTAKVKSIKAKETMTGIQSITDAATPVMQNVTVNNSKQVGIISGVDTRTVGIANTDMTTWTQAQLAPKFTPALAKETNAYPMPSGVYTLFNDKGYVVASIVIGEDNGIATNLVLVNSKDIKEERFEASAAKATNGEWVWSREVIDLNTGAVGKIYEKGDTPSVIDAVSMPQWTVAQIKLNGDNYVTGANKGAAITGAAYETNIANLENKISTSGKDLVAFKSTAINAEPSFVGNTLHVDNASDKGVPVHPDVKTVLIKQTDGASETTEFSGSNELDTVLATLNKDKNTGKVSFEITALVKGGRAITIVINDLVKTDGQINDITPDTKLPAGVTVDTTDRGDVVIYTATGVTLSLDEQVAAVTTQIKSEGYTSVEGPTRESDGTFTWLAKKSGESYATKFTYKNDSGSVVANAVNFVLNGQDTVASPSAQVKDVPGGTSTTSYLRYKASALAADSTFTYSKAGNVSTPITEGMIIDTGYKKVTVSAGSVDTSKFVSPDNGSTNYVKETETVAAASGDLGKGVKMGTTNKYMAYGSTYANLDKADAAAGTADGDVTIAAVNQICATVKNVTVGSVTTTEVALPYGTATTANNLGEDTAGKGMKVGTGAVAANRVLTANETKDNVSVEIGYVNIKAPAANTYTSGKVSAATTSMDKTAGWVPVGTLVTITLKVTAVAGSAGTGDNIIATLTAANTTLTTETSKVAVGDVAANTEFRVQFTTTANTNEVEPSVAFTQGT